MDSILWSLCVFGSRLFRNLRLLMHLGYIRYPLRARYAADWIRHLHYLQTAYRLRIFNL